MPRPEDSPDYGVGGGVEVEIIDDEPNEEPEFDEGIELEEEPEEEADEETGETCSCCPCQEIRREQEMRRGPPSDELEGALREALADLAAPRTHLVSLLEQYPPWGWPTPIFALGARLVYETLALKYGDRELMFTSPAGTYRTPYAERAKMVHTYWGDDFRVIESYCVVCSALRQYWPLSGQKNFAYQPQDVVPIPQEVRPLSKWIGFEVVCKLHSPGETSVCALCWTKGGAAPLGSREWFALVLQGSPSLCRGCIDGVYNTSTQKIAPHHVRALLGRNRKWLV